MVVTVLKRVALNKLEGITPLRRGIDTDNLSKASAIVPHCCPARSAKQIK
jgi:hypothetical protein